MQRNDAARGQRNAYYHFVRRTYLLLLAGCGRIAFEPTGGGGDDSPITGDARRDGAGSGQDAVTGGTGGETCATPRDIPLGQTLTGQTMSGAQNDFANPACLSGGVEVVYSFTSTAVQRTLTISADFDGVMALSSTCPINSGTCTPFTAGFPRSPAPTVSNGINYIIIDKTGGSGMTFSIGVQ
jgi:hypothetical protein